MGVLQLVLLIRGDFINKKQQKQKQTVKYGEGMKKEFSPSGEKRLCF